MKFTQIVWINNNWERVIFDGKEYTLDCLVMDISRWIFEQFSIINLSTKETVLWIKKIASAALSKD